MEWIEGADVSLLVRSSPATAKWAIVRRLESRVE